jgi:uncharacterized membrane protein YbhN (UPF0104 family)
LTARSLNRATSTTVTQILVFPWLVFWLLLLGLSLLRSASGAPIGASAGFSDYLVMWFVIMVSLNLALAILARTRLLRRFRLVATERFEAPRRWRWFGGRRQTPAGA